MNFSSYHREQKPLGLRLISLSVIFVFLFTQSDLQLVSALPDVVPAAVPDKIQNDRLSSDLEDIHYMQDLYGDDKDPLLTQGTQQAEKPVDQVSTETPTVSESQKKELGLSNFLNQTNPLTHAEGQPNIETDTEKGSTKVTYENGSYFKVETASNKYLEIADFTNPDDAKDLVVRKFVYDHDDKLNRDLARIITVSNKPEEQLNSYETYITDGNGNLLDLVETGKMVYQNQKELFLKGVGLHQSR